MTTFVGNVNSKIVHVDLSECVGKLHPTNAVFFEELYHALSEGYSECGFCLGLWGSEHLIRFNDIKRAAKEKFFGSCLVCGEGRGVQRAHIVPRSEGGVDVMPLCPNHHWNYDHGLLKDIELDAIIKWIKINHSAKFAAWILVQYKSYRGDQLGRQG